MPRLIVNAKIRRLALTKRGANKVRNSIFKSEGFKMGKIFKNESDDEGQALEDIGNRKSSYASGFILKAMRKLDLDEGELADKAGVAASAVNSLLDGEDCKEGDLNKIAKALNIPGDTMKNITNPKKAGNIAKADFLLEVGSISEQLRKGEIETDEATDYLDEVVIKYEQEIPFQEKPAVKPNVGLNELREMAGLKEK